MSGAAKLDYAQFLHAPLEGWAPCTTGLRVKAYSISRLTLVDQDSKPVVVCVVEVQLPDEDTKEGVSSRPTTLRIAHSCRPNSILYDGHIIPQQPLLGSDLVTVNANLLFYDWEDADHVAPQARCPSSFRLPCCCEPGVAATSSHTIGGFVSSVSPDQQQALSFYATPAVRAKAVQCGTITPCSSKSPWVVLRQEGGMGWSTFARTHIPNHQVLFREGGVLLPFATMHTIQISNTRHLCFSGGAEFLAHSCEPNVVVRVEQEGFILVESIREIGEGELIAFNYLTTEWNMHSAFDCLCRSKFCFGTIRGFKHVPESRRKELESLITDVIAEKMKSDTE